MIMKIYNLTIFTFSILAL